jgi:hypothetical protein
LPEAAVVNRDKSKSGYPTSGPKFETGTSRLLCRIATHSTMTFGVKHIFSPLYYMAYVRLEFLVAVSITNTVFLNVAPRSFAAGILKMLFRRRLHNLYGCTKYVSLGATKVSVLVDVLL